MNSKLLAAALISIGATVSISANASLVPFKTWNGTVGISSDGFGSTSQSGTISASVPVGSTVLAAYLYTGLFSSSSSTTYTGSLNGTAVTFADYVANGTACCSLASAKADVTSIVAPVINGGAGGVYDFSITEDSGSQDGEALVVVFSNSTFADATVALLDGFASVTGDTASINFASPLSPSAPGFFAQMFLGDNFSCCSQKSTVTVNGITITDNAGNNDDGVGSISNGQLITVGGFDDPFSPLLPSYADDHERYNLASYVNDGDTSIVVNTSNPSRDDNIFLAGFYVSGFARVNEPPVTVPEPESLALIGLGLISLSMVRRHKPGKA